MTIDPGTPIWLGNPSSVCRRVLERCDAFIDQTDEEGRMVTFGKVAETTRMMAGNLVHLARVLRTEPYPAPGSPVTA